MEGTRRVSTLKSDQALPTNANQSATAWSVETGQTLLDAALGAAWMRTLRATNHTVYSGWYGIAKPPLTEGPSVRVLFPLPNGGVTVFLRPEVGTDGSLNTDLSGWFLRR